MTGNNTWVIEEVSIDEPKVGFWFIPFCMLYSRDPEVVTCPGEKTGR